MAIWPYLHPSISTALMRPRRPKQYCLQLVIYIYIFGMNTSTSNPDICDSFMMWRFNELPCLRVIFFGFFKAIFQFSLK